MQLVCNVCSMMACDCNWSRCWCWMNAYQLYEAQNNKEEKIIDNEIVVVEKSTVTMYDEYKNISSQTWVLCEFNGQWVWSQCIHCWQYKYYAGNWYQCTRSE